MTRPAITREFTIERYIVILLCDLGTEPNERIMSGERSPTDLLEKTLARAKRDVATVTATGLSTASPLDGMKIRDIDLHTDERGSVFENFRSPLELAS